MRLTRTIACSASALCMTLAGCAHYSGQQSVAGPASAASPRAQTAGLRAQSGQTRRQVFDRLDTNGDGMISRSEADADPDLLAIFVTIDANSDDMLSPVEFVMVPISFGDAAAQTGAMHAQTGMTRQQVFDQLDTNHDGVISLAESEASPELAAIFVATDADSDGTLSAVEFAVVPITFDAGSSIGGTSSVGSGIAPSAPGWWPVQTPSQPNETQPGMLNPATGQR